MRGGKGREKLPSFRRIGYEEYILFLKGVATSPLFDGLGVGKTKKIGNISMFKVQLNGF